MQPSRKARLKWLLGEQSVKATSLVPRRPLAAILAPAVLVGSRSSVLPMWPRMPIVVTLVPAFRPKQTPTEVLFAPDVAEATQATLLILPTVLLRGATIVPRMALVPVFGQAVNMPTAGGVTLGHRLIGKENTETTFNSITIIETMFENIGWLTKNCRPTLPCPQGPRLRSSLLALCSW